MLIGGECAYMTWTHFFVSCALYKFRCNLKLISFSFCHSLFSVIHHRASNLRQVFMFTYVLFFNVECWYAMLSQACIRFWKDWQAKFAGRCWLPPLAWEWNRGGDGGPRFWTVRIQHRLIWLQDCSWSNRSGWRCVAPRDGFGSVRVREEGCSTMPTLAQAGVQQWLGWCSSAGTCPWATCSYGASCQIHFFFALPVCFQGASLFSGVVCVKNLSLNFGDVLLNYKSIVRLPTVING